MHYVVAYDVVNNRRREKVMNALKDHGLRVQYSVFECELDAARMNALRDRLMKMVDTKQDRIHIYPMCEACFFWGESFGPTVT